MNHDESCKTDRGSPLTLFFEAAAGSKKRLHKKKRKNRD